MNNILIYDVTLMKIEPCIINLNAHYCARCNNVQETCIPKHAQLIIVCPREPSLNVH